MRKNKEEPAEIIDTVNSDRSTEKDPDGILHAFDIRWGLTPEQIKQEYDELRWASYPWTALLILYIFILMLGGVLGWW